MQGLRDQIVADRAHAVFRDIAKSPISGFSYITYLNKEFQKPAAARQRCG
jgi:hypothetical protein